MWKKNEDWSFFIFAFLGLEVRFYDFLGGLATLTLTDTRTKEKKKEDQSSLFLHEEQSGQIYSPTLKNGAFFVWKDISIRCVGILAILVIGLKWTESRLNPKQAYRRRPNLPIETFFVSWTASNVNQNRYEVCWRHSITTRAINVVWSPKRQKKNKSWFTSQILKFPGWSSVFFPPWNYRPGARSR